MSLITQAFGSGTPDDSEWVAEDPAFAKDHPTLHAFLCSREHVGAKRRQTSTMTLVAEEGVFKAGLRDRDHQCSLWVSADSVAAVLDALETALGRRPVEWRKAADGQIRNRPKT